MTSEAAWSSDKERVVSVDDAGLVRGLRFGRAEVSAEYEDETGTATVTVPRLPVRVAEGTALGCPGALPISERDEPIGAVGG